MIKPRLSVIILNYKNAGLVRQCVQGVFKSSPRLNIEVIVVDNASGDDCLKVMAEKFPQVKTIALDENYGFAKGNNAGLKQATGEYALILNPDVAVLPGALEKLIAFMDEHPKVGIAGPRLTNPDGAIQMSAFTFPHFWLPIFRRTPLGYWPQARKQLTKYLMEDWDHKQNRTVDWLLGACLIVRREALQKVGLLDERYFMYVEDTDLCRRFWQSDYQVYYVADVTIVHYHQRASADALFLGLFNRITWIHLASWIKYFIKWGLRVPHPSDQR
ncbi:TPA: glycosyltransferase family 2 protein [Patescibacteria group bacterium]|nr:glycosyltransferase family 2 protein [Patescibacteria group bacterium]HCU47917.1 glycosyltransferase family 2 protein [Patescibacteria group bacterium]